MKRRWALGVALAALLLGACSGDDGGVLDSEVDRDGADTTVAERTTTTTPTVSARNAGFDLPRELTYGHVVFELTKAEFSNATPGTYLDPEPEPAGDELLYISFVAAFESDYPGVTDQWSVDDFQIVTAAGRTIAGSGVDFTSSVTVSGRGETEATVAFAVDEDDVRNASFQISDGQHLAATVPLTGSVPASPYPIVTAATGEAPVTYEGGCRDATGSVQVLGAEWDVDGGVDAKGQSILGSGTKRTLERERFLRVRVRAIAAQGTCGGTIVTGDHFRLITDGLPVGNENVSRSELLANGEGVDLIWGYRVPVTAQQLELEVGTAGGTTARFPIEKPATLP